MAAGGSLLSIAYPGWNVIGEAVAASAQDKTQARQSLNEVMSLLRAPPHRGRNRTLRDSISVPQLVFLPRADIVGNAAIFSPRWTIKAS
jgi:hypothetical protein